MALKIQHEELADIDSTEFTQIINHIGSIAKEVLVKELEVYHAKNEHQKIIETLEKLPQTQLDLLLISMLARAYNNIQNFQKAFELLKPLENECKKQPIWNYRIAYSCYYLDRDDLALSYFNNYLKTLDNTKTEQEEEEINEYIEIINQNKNCPYFSEPFKFRVRKVWSRFVFEESKLLQMLKNMKTKEEGEEILAKIKQILYPLFIEPSFGLNFNRGKWELTISSDLDDSIYPVYIYFKENMPQRLKANWNLFIGRQASKKNQSINLGNSQISPSDVHLVVRKLKKDTYKIIVYNEHLKFSSHEEYKESYEIAYILTEQVLGEVRYIKFIGETDISNNELQNSITLDKLPEYLKNNISLDISFNNSQGFTRELLKKSKKLNYISDDNSDQNLENEIKINFTTGMSEAEWESHSQPEFLFKSSIEYFLPEKYTLDQDKIQTLRTFGKTNIPRIVNAFIQLEGDEIAQEYHSCGAFIGMLILKFDFSIIQDDIHYLAKISSRLHEKLTDDHIVYGTAFGFEYAFIDFIAWDLEAVVSAFKQIVMLDEHIVFAGLKSIRSDSAVIRYK